MDRVIIMICNMQYVMGRVNAMYNANTLRAVRMQYAICEYAMGRANVICEYAMGRANAICDTRIGYARYANTLWAARIRYAICK